MTSTRAQSVRRHVRKLHKEGAPIVTFSEYVAGVQTAKYVPQQRPTFVKGKKESEPLTATDKFMQAFENKTIERTIDWMYSAAQANASKQQAYQLELLSMMAAAGENVKKNTFGYRVFLCGKCKVFQFDTICYPFDKNRTSKVTVHHFCPAGNGLGSVHSTSGHSQPSSMATNAPSSVQQDQEKRKLAEYLKEVANSGFAKVCLKVLNFDLISPDGKEIILSNPADKTSAILLNRLDHKVIDLTASFGAIAKGSSNIESILARARASHGSKTELNKGELFHVATLLQDCTFGFVRMHENRSGSGPGTIKTSQGNDTSSLLFVYLTSANKASAQPLNK